MENPGQTNDFEEIKRMEDELTANSRARYENGEFVGREYPALPADENEAFIESLAREAESISRAKQDLSERRSRWAR